MLPVERNERCGLCLCKWLKCRGRGGSSKGKVEKKAKISAGRYQMIRKHKRGEKRRGEEKRGEETLVKANSL